jgi:hypothetical protein
MNELLEVLRSHGAIIGFTINIKNNWSLRLGISEEEKMKLGNKKIDLVDSFIYLGSITQYSW